MMAAGSSLMHNTCPGRRPPSAGDSGEAEDGRSSEGLRLRAKSNRL